jgi:hypothetical protein
MTDSLKILGQSVPTIGVLTDIYTVPTNYSTTISSVIICNQGPDFANFSISIAKNGVADDPKQYIYFNTPLAVYDTFIATIGISLGSGDIVRAKSDASVLAFNIFGVEVI